MANRKILINRHSPNNAAPTASEMYLGEIAVSHPSTAISATTIWTKNGDVMVPFASCAMTQDMINAAIGAAEKVVAIAAGAGETHLTVESGGTAAEKTYTITTDDVMSEEEFNAYSAATKERIDRNVSAITDMVAVVSALTDVVVTGISGDTIIVAEKVDNDTGSNVYNLTHRTGAEVNGFNKLTTDAYGHVTAYTAVATEDIQALGFKTSAETGEDLEALSASVISLSAETIAEFTSAFTAIENLSADTDAAIAELSAGTIQLSADTKNAIAELSAGTIQLSADTDAAIAALSANSVAAIAALSAGTLQLSADTDAAMEEISHVMAAALNDLNTKYSAVTEDVEELSGATVAIQTGLGNLSAVTLTGVSLNNSPLAVSNHVVSVPVADDKNDIAGATDSGMVADAKAVKDYVEDVLSSSVEYKGSTASVPSSPSKGDLYIASADFMIGSNKVETGDFIIYNGTSWDIIEKNLNGAITGTLTADTVTLGDSTNSVKSLANGTSGQVLTIANGIPTWVDDPELSVVSAGTGNVVTEIAVNDHEITYTLGLSAASSADLAALSAGTIQLSADTDAAIAQLSGNVVAYVNVLSAGTIQLSADTDAAIAALSANSVAAIAALSAGTLQLSADTDAAMEEMSHVMAASLNDLNVKYSAVTEDINELSAGTIQLSADTVAAIAAAVAALDSVGSASTTGHYLTSVTITDGKISAVGEQAIPAVVPVTTVNGATGDTAVAVISGIFTGGTEGHELTLSATNMIFSAMTSQSADTAAMVANALSISGYATSESSALDTTVNYDGSAAQSLTFGKDTAAGKSMSMTSAGVVDVEIIDCGTY